MVFKKAAFAVVIAGFLSFAACGEVLAEENQFREMPRILSMYDMLGPSPMPVLAALTPEEVAAASRLKEEAKSEESASEETPSEEPSGRIGIEIGEAGSIKIFQGGPADKAGLLPGDILLAVNGERYTEATKDKVEEMIAGKVGSSVAILVKRPGQKDPVELGIVREVFEDDGKEVPPVKHIYIDLPEHNARTVHYTLVGEMKDEEKGEYFVLSWTDDLMVAHVLYLPKNCIIHVSDKPLTEGVLSIDTSAKTEGVPSHSERSVAKKSKTKNN